MEPDSPSCAEVVAALSDYLEGALKPHEERSCEAHLSACSTCSQTLAELRVLRSHLSRLPRGAAPSRLTEHIVGKLSEPAASEPPREKTPLERASL